MARLLRFLFVLCLFATGRAPAAQLVVERLAAEVPHAVATGPRAGDFEPVGVARLHERQRGARVWYRLRAVEAIPAAGEPYIEFESPYLTRIEAWRPGDSVPRHLSIYGPHADARFSTRALVLELPHGLKPGEAVYLRVHALVSAPMPIAVRSRDELHRLDLGFVAWRTAILATLCILVVIAAGFWWRVGDGAHGWFTAMLLGMLGYQSASGGELRYVTDAPFFVDAPYVANLCAALAVFASNAFMARFLQLARTGPRLLAALRTGSALTVVAACLLPLHAAAAAAMGNVAVAVSIAGTVVAAVSLALRGQRASRIVLLSWAPVMLAIALRAGELAGLWDGPDWSAHAMAATYVMAGVLLTLGLADQMLAMREERDEMRRRVATDPLTGVLSRSGVERALDEALADAAAHGTATSVIFFDVDHFKQINDAHGHRIGDECLRIVALRARGRLRAQDRIGRFGGDEMVVVLPDTRLDEARAVAEGLRVTVDCRPLSIDGIALRATLSLGVAEHVPGESAAALLARADEGLYASKAAGRNCASAAPYPATTDEECTA